MSLKNRLVAHRGDMTIYPENSLLALIKAAELGFRFIELDVQFSKDLAPIVIHDENLIRTTGIDKLVNETTTEELLTYKVLTPFQEDTALLNIVTLEAATEMLNHYPQITLFVEIKRQTLDHFDLEVAVDIVLNHLSKATFSVVIISFIREVVEYLEVKGDIQTGWVLSRYDEVNEAIANEMQPDYIFCNVKKINHPKELWRGPWKWVLYDVKNPTFAYELLEQGVHLVETGDIQRLSQSEFFQ